MGTGLNSTVGRFVHLKTLSDEMHTWIGQHVADKPYAEAKAVIEYRLTIVVEALGLIQDLKAANFFPEEMTILEDTIAEVRGDLENLKGINELAHKLDALMEVPAGGTGEGAL